MVYTTAWQSKQQFHPSKTSETNHRVLKKKPIRVLQWYINSELSIWNENPHGSIVVINARIVSFQEKALLGTLFCLCPQIYSNQVESASFHLPASRTLSKGCVEVLPWRVLYSCALWESHQNFVYVPRQFPVWRWEYVAPWKHEGKRRKVD